MTAAVTRPIFNILLISGSSSEDLREVICSGISPSRGSSNDENGLALSNAMRLSV